MDNKRIFSAVEYPVKSFTKEKHRSKKTGAKPVDFYDFAYPVSTKAEEPFVLVEKEGKKVQKLTKKFASDIASVEKIVYADQPDLINGEEDFFDDLQEAEQEGGNFSHGVYDGDNLIGYLIGFKDESEMNEDEEVAYISDMAILPEYRKGMVAAKLLKAFANETAKKGMSIEAECREESFKMLKNSRFIKKLGYCFTKSQKLPNYNAEEDFYWVRLDRESE